MITHKNPSPNFNSYHHLATIVILKFMPNKFNIWIYCESLSIICWLYVSCSCLLAVILLGFLIKLLLFTGYFKFQRIVKTNLISDILILHIMKTTRCTLVREIKEFLIQRMPGCRFSKPCAPLH